MTVNNENTTLPLDVELLVPHRRPVRIIDRLVEFRDKSGVVESLITSENLLIGTGGELDRIGFMELMAQSYAAVKGYHDLLYGRPTRKGFLVTAKKIEIVKDAFLGDLLTVSMETTAEIGEFAVAAGTVRRGDEILASGDLTLWVP